MQVRAPQPADGAATQSGREQQVHQEAVPPAATGPQQGGYLLVGGAVGTLAPLDSHAVPGPCVVGEATTLGLE